MKTLLVTLWVTIVLLSVVQIDGFSVPISTKSLSLSERIHHSLSYVRMNRVSSRVTLRAPTTCQGDDLMKQFEEERKVREEMDRIFKNAESDLQSIAKLELDAMKAEADQLQAQREEEWAAMSAKAAEALTSKVDSLAEEFLRSTGRAAEVEEDEDEAMEKFMGPTVVAIIGESGPLRDALKEKISAQQGLSISSCERLLETKGMTIEGTDTLIFCGDGEPLDRSAVTARCGVTVAGRAERLRRVVLLSSVGTERADKFPFSLQNAFSGALDKKRLLELGLVEKSKAAGFSLTTIRIGKAVKGSAGMEEIEVMPGDFFQEDTSVDAASEATLQALMYQPVALNKSLSIVSRRGPPPSQDRWDDEFLKLEGPELWRYPLGTVSASACRDWVQQAWAPRWIKKGNGLTTPVTLTNTAPGVQLVFMPSTASGFVSYREEKAQEKARAKEADLGKAAADKVQPRPPARQLDGGIEVVVEERPFPRVRAMRCNMDETTVVKETSEGMILESLSKEVQAWAASNK